MNEKYYCRTCKRQTNHSIIHEVKTQGERDEGYFQWVYTYSLIQCLGCETISFLETYGDSEMVEIYEEEGKCEYYENKTIYPYYLENVNELESTHYIPSPIREIYNETISAYKANCLILSAGGLRAIIEATCNYLEVRKDSLSTRIDLLHEKGYLTLNESKRLHAIRFLGNDALHEIENPPKESLIILFEVVNHLLENLFISDSKIKGRLETIIDTYEEFIKLLCHKITKEMVGKDASLPEILGKSQRLIPMEYLTEFESTLIDEINLSKLDFISLPGNKCERKYRIEKYPGSVFDW
ncbi:MAG: DUF4145 domain-containing protein [Bacteroidales bacterium]|nr:DUF4145 domain-containing protein [Bacteroidales bacterium]